jgi:hypothetical protein
MMLGCRSDRWLMISRCTFSSICSTSRALRHLNTDAACEEREGKKEGTFSPRWMYLTATSSPDARARMRRATPKLPDPMSRTCSYRSPSCIIGISIASSPVLSISTERHGSPLCRPPARLPPAASCAIDCKLSLPRVVLRAFFFLISLSFRPLIARYQSSEEDDTIHLLLRYAHSLLLHPFTPKSRALPEWIPRVIAVYIEPCRRTPEHGNGRNWMRATREKRTPPHWRAAFPGRGAVGGKQYICLLLSLNHLIKNE